MTVETSTPPAVREKPTRSRAHAFLLALPAITLILLELWVFLIAFAWAFVVLAGGTIITLLVLGSFLIAPGLWASWHVVRLATDAEARDDFSN